MSIKMCKGHSEMDPYKPCTEYEESYVGAVLATFERNGYNDSDFVAIVWDGERVIECEYASTRFWTYHNTATIDATPEVIEKAERYLADYLTRYYVGEAKMPAMGHRVRSTMKRGKNVGIEGVVRWIGEKRSAHGSWSYGYRLGIQVEGEKGYRFIDADKVEVLDEPDVDAIRKTAEQQAKQHQWRSLIDAPIWNSMAR